MTKVYKQLKIDEPINSIIHTSEGLLKVVGLNDYIKLTCDHCYLHNKSLCAYAACFPWERKDNESVIYKLVESN